MGRPKKNLEQNIFNSADIDETCTIESDTNENKRFVFSHPGWTEHVISLLTKDEKDKENGYPKSNALLRLVELLIGPIIENSSKIAFSVVDNGNVEVIVEHTLIVQDWFQLENNKERKVVAIGEGGSGKLIPPYNLYPAACASTKALGRAAKTMLQLRNITTAEEVEHAVAQNEDTITDNQLKGIEVMCKRLNIDMEQLLKSKYGNYSHIKELDKEFAKSILTFLTRVEQNEETWERLS